MQNCRCICLLDVCLKLLTPITLVRRLQTVMQEFGMGTNRLAPGPRYHRWASYSFFRLHKRKDGRLETRALLMKAVDTVPRKVFFSNYSIASNSPATLSALWFALTTAL